MHGTIGKTHLGKMYGDHKSNPVSDVLLKAADLIEQKGHAKNVMIDPYTGGMCFIGAINVAQGYNSWEENELTVQATLLVADVLGMHTPWKYNNVFNNVIKWNNEPDRTAKEVIDAMRLAAYQKQFV